MALILRKIIVNYQNPRTNKTNGTDLIQNNNFLPGISSFVKISTCIHLRIKLLSHSFLQYIANDGSDKKITRIIIYCLLVTKVIFAIIKPLIRQGSVSCANKCALHIQINTVEFFLTRFISSKIIILRGISFERAARK